MSEMGLGLENEKVWDYHNILAAKLWVDRGFTTFFKACGGITVEGKFLIFNNDACNGILAKVSFMLGENHLEITIGDNVVFSGHYPMMSKVTYLDDVVVLVEIIVGKLFDNDPVSGNVVEPNDTAINIDSLVADINQLDYYDGED